MGVSRVAGTGAAEAPDMAEQAARARTGRGVGVGQPDRRQWTRQAGMTRQQAAPARAALVGAAGRLVLPGM
ncbi:hypothetical protein GCM10010124_41250 [Pilimelia terevasa]|uniref:Uncharacterized protein n=1 Tax=Pilimelia terevasa TaxID=53372 RepID=A0A8J3FLL1_9ACTN|nr:hypothetical protein GCM10010124_41250 [Pilimelia terevasa]